MKLIFSILSFCTISMTTLAQNVGIGTTPSEFLLDINGRARIRHNLVTAGIYFDGPVLNLQGFMGMQSNDVLGFFSAVAGWQFGMNVNNGFMGFGTVTPTTSLDINGGFRWRGAFPQANALLMSKDNNGNATWQRPIMFGVSGSPDLADITFTTTNTWTKLYFSTITDYNQGIAWQPINSLFEAPVKGMYRFSLHLHHANKELGAEVRFIRRRAGLNYVVATQKFLGFSGNGVRIINSAPLDLHHDLLMEPGDQLWVELNPGFSYPAYILGAKRLYSMSGRLLFLQ